MRRLMTFFASFVLCGLGCGSVERAAMIEDCCGSIAGDDHFPPAQRETTHLVVNALSSHDASSLRVMVFNSDLIAVVRVKRILRQAHTPYNSSAPMQHTVFEAEVVQPLKVESLEPVSTVKIVQPGGELDWVEPRRTGKGFRLAGHPLLQIDGRYLVFLSQPSKRNPLLQQKGYLTATNGGVTGKAGELDEYVVYGGSRGILDFSTEIARAPKDSVVEAPEWQFEAGQPKKLTGRPVREVLKEVTEEISSVITLISSMGVDETRKVALKRQRKLYPAPRPAEETRYAAPPR